MDELSVVVDFAREVRVALLRGLEYNLPGVRSMTRRRTATSAYLGAICELMGCQIDLPKRPLSNQAAEGVVSDRSEVFICEFAARSSSLANWSHVELGARVCGLWALTRGALGTNERAIAGSFVVSKRRRHSVLGERPRIQTRTTRVNPRGRRKGLGIPWPSVPTPRPLPLPTAWRRVHVRGLTLSACLHPRRDGSSVQMWYQKA